MNCTDFEKNVMDYVEGTMDSVRSRSMKEHIDSCPECAKLAAAHRAVFESLNDSEPVKAPAGLTARILSNINAESPKTVLNFTPSANPVDCGVFEDNIAAYTDGLVDRELAGNMDLHKAACTSCENLAKAHELVLKSLNTAEPVNAPAGLAARIMTAVEKESATEKSPVIIKLFRKYGTLTTITAAASSLAAASIIIIGGLTGILSNGSFMPEYLSTILAQIAAIPYLAQAWVAGMIPADYWPLINLLLKPVVMPYLDASIPLFSIVAFFILTVSSTIYFSLSKNLFSPVDSYDNLV